MTNINKVTFTGRIKYGDIIKKINACQNKVKTKCNDALEYSFFDVSKLSNDGNLTSSDYSKIVALANSTGTSLPTSTSTSSTRWEYLTSTTSSLLG